MSLSLFRFSQRLLCESEVVGRDCILFGKLVFWVDLVHFFRSLESALRVETIQALKVKLVISAACYSFKLKNKTKKLMGSYLFISSQFPMKSNVTHLSPGPNWKSLMQLQFTYHTVHLFKVCIFLAYSQNCATTPADWRTFWSPQNKSHIH